MAALADAGKPTGFTAILAGPRLRFTMAFSVVMGYLLGLGAQTGSLMMLIRTLLLGFSLLVVFGAFEQWPRRLPSWIQRWVLQVVAVAVTIPVASAVIFALTHSGGGPSFYHVRGAMHDFSRLTGITLLVAPWTALAALVRQKDALARNLATLFQLERSELERQAVQARLSLLQAQVAPHFLFNTLANVQALVDKGSPVASAVLHSLTTYLRATVPRLGAADTTIGQELELVEAYIELMRMRMPDRLQFKLYATEGVRALRCPPMTLLTLVENAVRHGLDPSEDGGQIDVEIRQQRGRCHVIVRDTGIGLRAGGKGLGTGIRSLRERLHLAFGGDATVSLTAIEPHGARAELQFPARTVDV